MLRKRPKSLPQAGTGGVSRSTHDRDAAKIIPTQFSGVDKEQVEEGAVYLGQGGKIRELDPLVYLVHG